LPLWEQASIQRSAPLLCDPHEHKPIPLPEQIKPRFLSNKTTKVSSVVFIWPKFSDAAVLTDAGFIQPPVRSEPRIWSVNLVRLEIQVFMKKFSRIVVASPSEMVTIANVSNPSVSAPWWMSTFKRGPCPTSGMVSMRNLTPTILPTTWRDWKKKCTFQW